jgi:truncated hemoglobin YjbI
MISLYEKLGSAEGINSIIDKYFDYMLTDPNVNHFYKNTSM